MTDTLAETVQTPLKRPCNDAIDPNESDKRQRVEVDDPSDILEDVRAVQNTIGEVCIGYALFSAYMSFACLLFPEHGRCLAHPCEASAKRQPARGDAGLRLPQHYRENLIVQIIK